MAKDHKGLREFGGDEIGALAIGQTGFVIQAPNTEITCGAGAYADIKYFIAIKCVDAACEVEARRVAPSGTDFTTDSNGVYQGTTSTSNNITIDNTDIIFGAFDKVVSKSGGGYLMLYIGK